MVAEPPSPLPPLPGGPFEVAVGADLVYEARHAELVLAVVARLLREGVVREAEEFLAQTQQHSTVDDSAFL